MSAHKDFFARFGFHTTPFTRELRVAEHAQLGLYAQALDGLFGAVDKRMSAALIAPAGTGKTALLRALLERLPEARYRAHYVKVTELSKRELCRECASAIGAEPAGSYPTLVRRLQERFTSDLDIDGLRPVLVLDEGHDIRPEVLGILRILTNFEMDSRLVLSIVLAGQPPLAKLLRQDRLQDVAHRLAHCATLRPLSRAELTGYVEHRCHVAGASLCPFDAHALEVLYELGRGNLRATDQLALEALELAHRGNCDTLESTHISEARRRLWP